ncbi:DUF4190 domain-containing protein [Kutzneria kofuensis]|uniref:Regulator of septum formation n=1 Tax=Kutzneria kofuensis TaxID=103725 RepID=A0A7W9KGW8_9PSEU|nr:DUF4190 domain-containing protein [Kutzneria kofuensis]MBB5892225.1 hypothetical protein [Kutzneria kofuensis]
MSTEHEQQPAYQNYPAMPPAQPGPLVGVKPGVNGFAITSFVLGIVGFVGAVLGVIFGIVALADIRRTRQRGKGLAVSGIVLSGVWALAWVAFISFAFVYGFQQAASQQAASSGANVSYNFQPGQCFDRDNTSKAVTVRDCVQPHDAEVFAVEPLSGTSYPGVTAVQAVGRSKCTADSDRFLTPGLNYPDIDVHYLYPQQASWARGDRSVKCYYADVKGAKMTGHAKDSGSPYTEDQKRYLAAVAPYNQIVDEEADTDTWTAERDVVARSVPVVQKEIDVLKAGPWPADIQPVFDKLVAEKQLELAARQRAAAATDEDSFDDALDDADSHDGTDQARVIRVSLHLPPR